MAVPLSRPLAPTRHRAPFSKPTTLAAVLQLAQVRLAAARKDRQARLRAALALALVLALAAALSRHDGRQARAMHAIGMLERMQAIWRTLASRLIAAPRALVFGRRGEIARISIHDEPVRFKRRDGDDKERTTSLRDVLEACESLMRPYLPTSWLSSGHAATVWSTLAKGSAGPPIAYSRQLLRAPDGGTIAVDLASEDESAPQDTPILVVLHGLTGGSSEAYVVNVLREAVRKQSDGGLLGWRAAVVNSRGCAGSEITSDRLYHGGWTYDLRCALEFLQDKFPGAPLYGIGFSLGGNMMAKYVGQAGPKTPLSAAVTLGAPWDFWAAHLQLESSWLGRRVYSRALATNLKRLLAKHRQHFENDPRVDLKAVYANRDLSLYEFDDAVTAKLGGFASAKQYYEHVSASRYVSGVSIPLLSLGAFDDPVVSVKSAPFDAARSNPNVAFVTTRHGGHLGWWQGELSPTRWVGRVVVEFLAQVHAAGERVQVDGFEYGAVDAHDAKEPVGYELVGHTTQRSDRGEVHGF